MKKKLALVLILMLSVCALVAALSACNKSKPEEPSDISRSVSSLIVGEDDDFAVSVESGIRETPFIADGKVGDVQEFCELTVLPLTVGEFDSVAYELYAAGEGAATLSGTLTESSFGEYKTTLTLDFVPAGIRIGTVESFELNETRTAYNVRVRLAADMTALHDVILIKNQDLDELHLLNANVQDNSSPNN